MSFYFLLFLGFGLGLKIGGHVNIRGPQLFYLFFHALYESSSFWGTICGLELCFVVFVSNNQGFDFIIICNII